MPCVRGLYFVDTRNLSSYTHQIKYSLGWAVMNRTVILYCCHFWSREIENEFLRLKKCCDKYFDVVLSYDCSSQQDRSPDDFSKHLFTVDQIRKKGYPFHEQKGIWYNIDYPILDYYTRNSQYDFYWRIEYDVRFGGDWSDFFRHFTDNRADLLGTYFKTYQDQPDWHWWDKMNLKTDHNNLRGIFFPIARFSKRSLAFLDDKYRKGAAGYCELIVPTLLNMERMNIEDIGKKFYDLFTFNYDGMVIRKKGKLHHPVKKIKFGTRLKNTLSILKNRRMFP